MINNETNNSSPLVKIEEDIVNQNETSKSSTDTFENKLYHTLSFSFSFFALLFPT